MTNFHSGFLQYFPVGAISAILLNAFLPKKEKDITESAEEQPLEM